jgi:hypothetical protein
MAGDARDAEAVWRDLVANYATSEPPAGAPAPWPEREDLPGPGGPPGGCTPGEGTEPTVPGQPAAGTDPVPGVIPAPPVSRIIRPASPAPLPPADDDEHFVPPEPPPLPRLDPVSKGAWLALFGGPAYLLFAVLMGWEVPSVAAFCAVAAFVGGFATLVVRMQDRPPTDSGPDDGAVV